MIGTINIHKIDKVKLHVDKNSQSGFVFCIDIFHGNTQSNIYLFPGYTADGDKQEMEIINCLPKKETITKEDG